MIYDNATYDHQIIRLKQRAYDEQFDKDKKKLAIAAIDTIIKFLETQPHPFVPLLCDDDCCALCQLYNEDRYPRQ